MFLGETIGHSFFRSFYHLNFLYFQIQQRKTIFCQKIHEEFKFTVSMLVESEKCAFHKKEQLFHNINIVLDNLTTVQKKIHFFENQISKHM